MRNIEQLLQSYSGDERNKLLIFILEAISSGGGNPAVIALLTQIRDVLLDIDSNTDDLETIANAQLSELQDININTANLEALLTAIQGDTANLPAILTELQNQTIALNLIISELTGINTSIQNADANNVAELQALQTQLATDLASVIAELTAINGNTTPLEASLTAIEMAINNNTTLTVAELQDINTNLGTVITELQSANATLLLINNQFGGSPVITRVDISGNGAYVIPGGSYFSIELIVTAGSVSDGVIPYEEGFIETAPIKGATHPGITLDATGATAYVKLMTN